LINKKITDIKINFACDDKAWIRSLIYLKSWIRIPIFEANKDARRRDMVYVGVPERKAMSSAAISDSMWKLSATSAIEFVI
jgi:hypothetical protein